MLCLPNFFPPPNTSIAYIEFKSEADAEKMLEEAQGIDVQGRSIIVDFVGEKSQKGAKGAGRFYTFSISAVKSSHNWQWSLEKGTFPIHSASLSPQRSVRPIKPWW